MHVQSIIYALIENLVHSVTRNSCFFFCWEIAGLNSVFILTSYVHKTKFNHPFSSVRGSLNGLFPSDIRIKFCVFGFNEC
jgi:hypothetical protein